MNLHTKGPWRVGDAGHTIFGPKRENGLLPLVIAYIKTEGNASLIAAAPELLEALKELCGFEDQSGYEWDQAIEFARNALRKVCGK